VSPACFRNQETSDMKAYYRPPRLPSIVLNRFLPGRDRTYLSGDFDEIYNSIRTDRGGLAAGFWYWSQLVRSLPTILCKPIYWSFAMFKNYLKIAFRQFKRQKGYSFINIAGLSVGMACFLLIMLFIRYEYSYDRYHLKAERIYQVNVEQNLTGRTFTVRSSPVPLSEALKAEVPEVENFTRLSGTGRILVVRENRRFTESGASFADPGIFEMFTFDLLSGDRATALDEKNVVVLSEKIAVKYFGHEEPVGQILMLDNELPVRVTGVFADFPLASTVRPEILISFDTLRDLAPDSYFANWTSQVLTTFVLLPQDISVPEIEGKFLGVLQNHAVKGREDQRVLRLDQLSRMHLYSEVNGSGDRGMLLVFLGAGILILLTACINFMNLATARSSKRAKEVGLRKVVGAERKQLIRQFMGESLIYAALSLILAFLLAAAFIPLLNGLTGQELRFIHMLGPGLMPLMLGVAAACGLLAGSYPALVLSGFQPVSVLKGAFRPGARGALFRKLLVAAQFSISILLVLCTLILSRQLNFLQNKPLGFKKDQILVIRSNDRSFSAKLDSFREELLRNPRIRGVSGSAMLPSSIGRYNNVTWEGAAEDEKIELIHNSVDYDFLDTYEIELVEGRNFKREFASEVRGVSRDENNAGGVILNEEAVRRFGWDSAVGKRVIQVFGQRRINFPVVGVIKDFHFRPLQYPIVPMNLFLDPSDLRYISIKIQPQEVAATVKFIEATWSEINPQFPLEHFFLDTVFARQYQSETKLRSLFGYFSGLAIFIACLGLLGLAAFAAELRTKEIGIRKVLGASTQGLVTLLSREFTYLVLAANLIAWPLAYIAMGKWLKNFAYRIELTQVLWLFPLAGLLALLFAWLTVGYQAMKAARTNPIDSLRYE
jgi:putative ABC transport system permease protein